MAQSAAIMRPPRRPLAVNDLPARDGVQHASPALPAAPGASTSSLRPNVAANDTRGGEPIDRAEAAAAERALVQRALAGDRNAQASLYRAHAHAVMGLAIRLLGRTSEAEDVVQDSFVSAFERLSQLRDGALFRAWLCRITVHQVHRRFRRRQLLRALGFDAGGYDAGLAQLAAPGLSPEARAELALIDTVLNTLPSPQRIAWMLRHVEGHELTEVAAECGTSLATIKRWIASAQAHIDTKLGAVS